MRNEWQQVFKMEQEEAESHPPVSDSISCRPLCSPLTAAEFTCLSQIRLTSQHEHSDERVHWVVSSKASNSIAWSADLRDKGRTEKDCKCLSAALCLALSMCCTISGEMRLQCESKTCLREKAKQAAEFVAVCRRSVWLFGLNCKVL